MQGRGLLMPFLFCQGPAKITPWGDAEGAGCWCRGGRAASPVQIAGLSKSFSACSHHSPLFLEGLPCSGLGFSLAIISWTSCRKLTFFPPVWVHFSGNFVGEMGVQDVLFQCFCQKKPLLPPVTVTWGKQNRTVTCW